MAEQTFKSPGFFESEIDLTAREGQLTGTPAGVAGTSKIGPAFVPVTVGSISDFVRIFGDLDPTRFGPYAVNEFLKHRNALTYVRVLGAGANKTSSDITNTLTQGIVKNAGFIIKATSVDSTAGGGVTGNKYDAGCVQFIVANHEIHESAFESIAYPIFTDNDSFGTGQANIVRGMLFMGSGSRMQIMNHDADYSHLVNETDYITTGSISAYNNTKNQGTFKLVISSSGGTTYSNDENYAGIKIFTASLDPYSDHYIGKILNKDPSKFQEEHHLLYGEFPVPSQVARVKNTSGGGTVAVLSGSDSYLNLYGRFDTRYRNSKTTSFISQPFGEKEYNLFHFETLNDGANSSTQVKVSIANIKRSTDPLNEFGSFSVYVRDFSDSDLSPMILEQYNDLNLDPNSENYIAKKIGDNKIFYNFDAISDDERRLVRKGKYRNNSSYIRVVMSDEIENLNVPKVALPFGFRGIPMINTNASLTDTATGAEKLTGRLDDAAKSAAINNAASEMSGSILPPIPFTIKSTLGKVATTGNFGSKGNSEVADPRIYWGVKTTELPSSASISQAVLNTNAGGEANQLVINYTKFLGIQQLESLITGSFSDEFNNNKFTLSRVALGNTGNISSDITGSAEKHILETAYLRNGKPNGSTYRVTDGVLDNRITLGSLVSHSEAKYFNRFSNYNKFTNIFFGGFDGLNILDKDIAKMNDKATSTETGGKGSGDNLSRIDLHADYNAGVADSNNIIASYRAATKILTDPMSSQINILAIPGQRDTYITDYVADKIKEYGKAIYLMDIPNYSLDSSNNRVRLFDDDLEVPSVRETSEAFDARGFDNNFCATYFPNITIQDVNTNRLVRVPSSIAALGALAFNDSISYPWFAPAGFNRGSLEFVRNTHARLTTGDRDTLYEARINPITNFPNTSFVIFGQKTLQFAKSSLDRVNVRRMLLEVRRLVENIANQFVFEQNNQSTRNRFIGQINPLLSTIQTQQGIDSFRVVMDSSNNTPEDSEQNRLNGRIVLVPTRAIEFIAIDFIITNSGVNFE